MNTFSLSLAFCNFLTVTQRMCMAVSPWTMVLMVWVDWNERRKEQERCQDPSSSSQIEDASDKTDTKLTEVEILSARNLPQFPCRKKSILSMEEDQFQDHHKKSLGIIWGMSLLCGFCSEQALDQSKNSPSSLTRRMTSPVEIVSILLAYPVPALLTLGPCMMSLKVSPQLKLLPNNPSTRTSLILSTCYILSILPSLLAELMYTNSNLAIMMVIKFSLASFHIIFEPIVILYMRPPLMIALRMIFRRQKK